MGSVTVNNLNNLIVKNKHMIFDFMFKALCCVDKKGILSWPNPTAEKVFFLQNTSKSTSRASYVDPSNCKEAQRKSYDSTMQNQGTYRIVVILNKL